MPSQRPKVQLSLMVCINCDDPRQKLKDGPRSHGHARAAARKVKYLKRNECRAPCIRYGHIYVQKGMMMMSSKTMKVTKMTLISSTILLRTGNQAFTFQASPNAQTNQLNTLGLSFPFASKSLYVKQIRFSELALIPVHNTASLVQKKQLPAVHSPEFVCVMKTKVALHFSNYVTSRITLSAQFVCACQS